jgi:predicted TIM-barrel fold metal-dependent hydrolase
VADVGRAGWLMVMKAPETLISADSHVTEPADLWCERLDRKYRDRAPRVIRDYGRDRYLFVAPGVSPFAIASGFGAGKQGRELKQHLRRGYEAARAGGWDPVERLKDQDLEGIACEVLYPTHGMRLFSMQDAELQRACFGVYTDWIAQFAAHNRYRLVPLAPISLYDVRESVKEMERVARLGFGGVLIWGAPPEAQPPYGARSYDAFWEAASSLRLPVSLHCITSGTPQTRSTSAYVQYLDIVHDVQRSLAEIVCSGVLDRFPELLIVSAENDCGWFPHFLFRLDHAHEKFGKFKEYPLKMPPSAYVCRQVYATFQEDSTAMTTSGSFGIEHYMWASDYPHADSTWPNSRRILERALSGVSEEAVAKVVSCNAARIYLQPSAYRTTSGASEPLTQNVSGRPSRPDSAQEARVPIS